MSLPISRGVSLKNISVIVGVYNEAFRIESFLVNYTSWSDDVIVIDKSSTDTTAELVKASGARLVEVPYTDGVPTQSAEVIRSARHDWILFVTASDLISPELVQDFLDLINQPGFDFDLIEYPYLNYVFGIEGEHSPWPSVLKRKLVRKSVVDVQDRVHEELQFTSEKVYSLPFNQKRAMSHLTHENLDIFFERHHRYAKLEIEKFKHLERGAALKKAGLDILRYVRHCFLHRKAFLLGWDGIALSMGLISYYIFVFLHVWQHFDAKAPRVYNEMRADHQKRWKDWSARK